MIGQLNPAYYDAKGNVIVASNPPVKKAWNLTMQGIAKGESAGLAAFSTSWNTGFKEGTFATVTCPAWMMGYIQGQAPNSAGDWDIAAVPGGGGSWGGSFLAVPKQSKNQELAAELVKFLTSPASEAYVFKQTGNLPSEPALLLDRRRSQNFKNPFFTNAPVGKIFANSVMALKPQITGPHQGDIQTASTNAIQRVEQKKQSAAAVVGAVPQGRRERRDLISSESARREAGRIPHRPAGARRSGVDGAMTVYERRRSDIAPAGHRARQAVAAASGCSGSTRRSRRTSTSRRSSCSSRSSGRSRWSTRRGSR